jgi:hypothetical protein
VTETATPTETPALLCFVAQRFPKANLLPPSARGDRDQDQVSENPGFRFQKAAESRQMGNGSGKGDVYGLGF